MHVLMHASTFMYTHTQTNTPNTNTLYKVYLKLKYGALSRSQLFIFLHIAFCSVFQKDSNEWDKEITFWNQTNSCYRPLMLMLYMSITLTQLNRTEQRMSFLEKF